MFQYDVVVIGGFGHVGLPLAISLADAGKRVCALDINRDVMDKINHGEMPFIEYGADKILRKVLKNKRLSLSIDAGVISLGQAVIIVIGTPVDEHLNPEFELIRKTMESYKKYFVNGQLIILRSTVYPGTTDMISRWFKDNDINVDVAFCPERIAEGYAIKELRELPQIVSAVTDRGFKKAKELFFDLTTDIIRLKPVEAELAKLFTNVWRYIKFATANQFFIIANDHKANFYKIYEAMTYNYPRSKDLPRPGFAAGPCLFKDAMQLAAFNNNNFYLGHAAMLLNEGLPNYIVNRLKISHKLREMSVGILGMAFKADVDDKRESLSYKLKKILSFEAKKVFVSDVYIKENDFVSQYELIKKSDIIIIASPHKEYKKIKFPKNKIVVDIWNIYGLGCII
ncbi:MAG: nucleotide sugar dehydrogenase [Elusimicrobia bacterium]|jgi:UDP-N-acetyl-D-mannosaminuronic acid dehydrogenase|nr:nucleotide sugar dehydrogenase [Elusimicrobiota bacterium]